MIVPRSLFVDVTHGVRGPDVLGRDGERQLARLGCLIILAVLFEAKAQLGVDVTSKYTGRNKGT